MAKLKAVMVADADKPIRHHFTPDDRRQALDLITSGLSFRETLAQLPFSINIATLHGWFIRLLSEAGPGVLEETFIRKKAELKLHYLLAADELLACSVELGRQGDGKGAQGAMFASGISLDKSQLLDGKPSSMKYGRYDFVHGPVEALDHGNDDSIHLIEAARTPDDAVTDVD